MFSPAACEESSCAYARCGLNPRPSCLLGSRYAETSPAGPAGAGARDCGPAAYESSPDRRARAYTSSLPSTILHKHPARRHRTLLGVCRHRHTGGQQRAPCIAHSHALQRHHITRRNHAPTGEERLGARGCSKRRNARPRAKRCSMQSTPRCATHLCPAGSDVPHVIPACYPRRCRAVRLSVPLRPWIVHLHRFPEVSTNSPPAQAGKRCSLHLRRGLCVCSHVSVRMLHAACCMLHVACFVPLTLIVGHATELDGTPGTHASVPA